jgi:hypothetical protein
VKLLRIPSMLVTIESLNCKRGYKCLQNKSSCKLHVHHFQSK